MPKVYAPIAANAAMPRLSNPVQPTTMFKPSAMMAKTMTVRSGEESCNEGMTRSSNGAAARQPNTMH